MCGRFRGAAYRARVGNDFVVEADLVQVAAAVIQVVDLSAVGRTVAVRLPLKS